MSALPARPIPRAAGRHPVATELRKLVEEHFDFVWRTLYRLGVAEKDVDDAAQRVFLIAADKFAAIAPGAERSYLLRVALNTAWKVRRGYARRRDDPHGDLADLVDQHLLPDEQLERSRAQQLLEGILGRMEDSAREVFVLFEYEGMTLTEIADLLEMPRGTAASRLRRARRVFAELVLLLRQSLTRDEP